MTSEQLSSFCISLSGEGPDKESAREAQIAGNLIATHVFNWKLHPMLAIEDYVALGIMLANTKRENWKVDKGLKWAAEVIHKKEG